MLPGRIYMQAYLLFELQDVGQSILSLILLLACIYHLLNVSALLGDETLEPLHIDSVADLDGVDLGVERFQIFAHCKKQRQ